MASGNLKGPLGPIMLALLIALAMLVLYAVNDPELSQEVGNERLRDPEFLETRLKYAFFFGGGALVLGALYKLLRK